MFPLTDSQLLWFLTIAVLLLCAAVIQNMWINRRARVSAAARTPERGAEEAKRAKEILATFAREFRIPTLKPHEAGFPESDEYSVEVIWRGRDELGIGRWSVGHQGVLFDGHGNSIDEKYARELAKQSQDSNFAIPPNYLFELTNALRAATDVVTPIVRHQWAEWKATGRPASG